MAKGRLKGTKRPEKKAQQIFKPKVRLDPSRVTDNRRPNMAIRRDSQAHANTVGQARHEISEKTTRNPSPGGPLPNNRGAASQRQTPIMPTPKRKRTTSARLQ